MALRVGATWLEMTSINPVQIGKSPWRHLAQVLRSLCSTPGPAVLAPLQAPALAALIRPHCPTVFLPEHLISLLANPLHLTGEGELGGDRAGAPGGRRKLATVAHKGCLCIRTAEIVPRGVKEPHPRPRTPGQVPSSLMVHVCPPQRRR